MEKGDTVQILDSAAVRKSKNRKAQVVEVILDTYGEPAFCEVIVLDTGEEERKWVVPTR